MTNATQARQRAEGRIHEAPVIRRTREDEVRAAAVARRPAGGLSGSWTLALALCWPVVTAVCVALEPAATGDGGVLAQIVGMVFFVTLIGAVSSAVGRAPSAIAWSYAAGAGIVGMTAACPLSAHHATVGAWWAGQWAAAAAGLVLTTAAARHLRRG